MIKKITISMMICVTLFLSVQQSYARASSIASNSAEVLRGAWQSVVMGIAAAGAAGLQTKQIIDDNRDALVAKANAAWDKMSVESQRVFGQALDAGRLGASQTYNELYGAIEGVFDDVYGSKATITNLYSFDKSGRTLIFTIVNNAYSFSYSVTNYSQSNYTGSRFFLHVKDVLSSDGNYYIELALSLSITDYGTNVILDLGQSKESANNFYRSLLNAKTIGAVSSLLKSKPSYPSYKFNHVLLRKSDGTIAQESIYDQALQRAKEQDIPKMRDAGLVLPEPTITGAQGQKLRYDAQTGTLVLPDGSIYTGDASWSYPKPTIGVNKNPVWQDTATGQDTDIWTGDKTDTITGNPAIPDTGVGEGTDSPTITTKLDKILEGVRAIPDAIVTGITTIFVPTATPTAFSNMIKQFTGLLVLPSFAWLTNSDLACSRVQDVKVTIMGKSLTIVSLDFVMQAKTFYMPIMRGFLWFLFGWYAYKKIIAMINKVDGVSQ